MILGEIEARVLEDAQRRESEARARAEREVRWRAAMAEAKERAVQDQFAEVLREEARRWRFCGKLPRSVSIATFWNVVLPNWVEPWTGRLGNRPDAGWSGHVNTRKRWTPCAGFRGCRLRVIRRQKSSRHI